MTNEQVLAGNRKIGRGIRNGRFYYYAYIGRAYFEAWTARAVDAWTKEKVA